VNGQAREAQQYCFVEGSPDKFEPYAVGRCPAETFPVTVHERHNVTSKNLVTIPHTSKSSINMNKRCPSIMTNSSQYHYAASAKTISLLHAISSVTFAPMSVDMCTSIGPS
jgi:hypothetical protein